MQKSCPSILKGSFRECRAYAGLSARWKKYFLEPKSGSQGINIDNKLKYTDSVFLFDSDCERKRYLNRIPVGILSAALSAVRWEYVTCEDLADDNVCYVFPSCCRPCRASCFRNYAQDTYLVDRGYARLCSDRKEEKKKKKLKKYV